MDFRWNDWNIDHATSHGITIEEIEALVESAKPPFPEYRGDGKWIVKGQSIQGRYIQAIYIVDEEGTAFAIHSRALTESEKRQLRRRTR